MSNNRQSIFVVIAAILSAIAASVTIASSVSFRGVEARETRQNMSIEELQKQCDQFEDVLNILKKHESLLVVINTRLEEHWGGIKKWK